MTTATRFIVALMAGFIAGMLVASVLGVIFNVDATSRSLIVACVGAVVAAAVMLLSKRYV